MCKLHRTRTPACLHSASEFSESLIQEGQAWIAYILPEGGCPGWAWPGTFCQPAPTHHRQAAFCHFGLEKPQTTWDTQAVCRGAVSRRSFGRRRRKGWEGDNTGEGGPRAPGVTASQEDPANEVRARPAPAGEHARPAPLT